MITLRSYLKFLLRRLPLPSERKVLRLVQFCSLAIIITLASALWLHDWYQSKDNINGILVEVHGALFEVLLLSVLFDWYSRTRERLLHADITSALYYRLYQAATACLREMDTNFIVHEKQYIHFGEKMAITRAYGLVDYITKDEDPDILSAMHPSIEDLERRHLEAAKKFLESIRQSYGAFVTFVDKELLLIMLEAEEATEDRVLYLSTPRTSKSDGRMKKSVKDVFDDSHQVAQCALRLKSTLETRADRIESREEHRRSVEEHRRKTKEKIAAFREAVSKQAKSLEKG